MRARAGDRLTAGSVAVSATRNGAIGTNVDSPPITVGEGAGRALIVDLAGRATDQAEVTELAASTSPAPPPSQPSINRRVVERTADGGVMRSHSRAAMAHERRRGRHNVGPEHELGGCRTVVGALAALACDVRAELGDVINRPLLAQLDAACVEAREPRR